MDASTIIPLLQQMLAGENAIRKNAEAAYIRMKAEDSANLSLLLLQTASNTAISDLSIRKLATVLLRRLIEENDSFIFRMDSIGYGIY